MLQQQEEMVRRGERERRALTDKIKDLERTLQASETDKKHTQVHTFVREQYVNIIDLKCASHGSDLCSVMTSIWWPSVGQYQKQNNRCHMHILSHLLWCLISAHHMSVFNASTYQNNSVWTTGACIMKPDY